MRAGPLRIIRAVSWRTLLPWLVVLVVAGLAGRSVLDGDEPPHPAAGPAVATVVRVVDGAPIAGRLADGQSERVRYIGVDTPESVKPNTPVQCFAKAASAFNA